MKLDDPLVAKAFWTNVSAALKEQGLSWEWLANTLNCNAITLLSKRNHYSNISLTFALAISTALQLSLEKLCGCETQTRTSNYSTSSDERERIISKRISIFNDTLDIINKGEYTITNSTIKLEEPPKSIYNFKKIDIPPRKLIPTNDTIIKVVSSDCLKLASKLSNENPLVLNMANRHSPDYCAKTGSGTQEAYLLRCSNYSQTLFPMKERAYPIGRDHGFIYSKDVMVFKDTEENGYKLLSAPYKINIVAVAPIFKPVIINGKYLEADHACMENKIKSIFNCAIRYKHKVLILGALGCGASQNPPELVAKVFHEVLSLPEYRNQFKKIFFAIKKQDETIVAFKKEFE